MTLAKSLQAAAGNSMLPNYIEDVFSTYLYDGGGVKTITNNIDLAGEGGLVWIKARTVANSHAFCDTARGNTKYLRSDTTGAESTYSDQLTSFNSNGFSLADSGSTYLTNAPGRTYVSWTFRKQPKFFDVVTYTGNGTAGRQISHALGSAPGFILIKSTSSVSDWSVYHRSLGATQGMTFNSTYFAYDAASFWNNTAPTSSVFTVGTDSTINQSGQTYVAYLFAHNAGGFGATGTDNVVSCGSFTLSSGTGSTDVNLGYEPQWLLAKPSTDPGFATNWNLYDTMRGWVNTTNAGNVNLSLSPNLSSAEAADKSFQPTATGFTMLNSQVYPGVPITYIYIAIRRGPMKVPTDGTEVFNVYNDGDTTPQTIGFPVDMFFDAKLSGAAENTITMSRLIGPALALFTSSTAAEGGGAGNIGSAFQNNTTFRPGIGFDWWCGFRRAPGFFDEVCFNGPTSGSTTQTHNLLATPELMIVRPRSIGSYWYVYSASLGIGKYLVLNLDDAQATSSNFWVTAPTSTAFTCSVDNMGSSGAIRPHVAYLFASCPGVSKVGSYTGTGTTQTIPCGFAAGARFVLIKRTDSTGDWYVWDSARGIVAGNDPYLRLNSTAAQVTNTDYIDPASSGFAISSTAPAAINASGGSYIFLAIA